MPQLEAGSLHHAAAHGDVGTVTALLDSGVDVNAVDAHGWTALYYAVLAEQEAVVQHLCDNGAYVYHVDASGFSLIRIAALAFGKDAPAVQILGRSTNRQLNESWLHYYVRVGKTAKAISHIEAQADPQEFVRSKHNSYGGGNLGSAINVAAQHGDLELLRYLIEKMDMPLDHIDNKFLIDIAVGNHVDIARYLLSRGVKIKLVEKKRAVWSISDFTLLHYAAWHGSLAMVELLVEELGADVNTPADESYRYRVWHLSPLQAAARDDDNLAVVKFLVEKGAKIDYSNRDFGNPLRQTPLEWARSYGSRGKNYGRVWEFLYAQGLEQGKLLHVAVKELRVDDVKRLVARGADVNAQNHRGYTPLQIAAGIGHIYRMSADELRISTNIAQLLIEGGADVNLGRSRTWKTLLEAIYRKNLAMVELFLANDADVTVSLSNGEDALQLAQEKYDEDNDDVARRIVALLEDHAAQHVAVK